MKRLKKGPEINFGKLRSGDLKLPKPLGDLYRELRGQHLLPIVILLIIGLVAVPMLVTSSGQPDSREISAQTPSGESSTKQGALKVSEWTPGLLDYKKSLRGAHPSDPFAPKVASGRETKSSSSEVEPAPAPSEIEVGGSPENPTGEAPNPVGEETPIPSAEAKSEESEGHAEEPKENESGAVTIDVQVTTIHEQGGIDRNPVRRQLAQLTKLPSESTPAFTYVGPSEDGSKAMMSVSPEVTAMIGASKCVVHAEPCSLLALQVGAPETIVFGPRGLTYRIELVRIGNHGLSVGSGTPNTPGTEGRSPTGKSPAPRGADALIGVGSRRVVERHPNL